MRVLIISDYRVHICANFTIFGSHPSLNEKYFRFPFFHSLFFYGEQKNVHWPICETILFPFSMFKNSGNAKTLHIVWTKKQLFTIAWMKNRVCLLSTSLVFSLYRSQDHQLMQLLDRTLPFLCFYWFQPDTETDRKKGPFQEEVKWSSSEWRVAFNTLLTRWKNVTIMEALAADSELIGWVPPGQSGAHSPCSQTRANKRPMESAWTGGEASHYQASL